MTDVETDAQERHLSFDNEASSPLDGDDGARGEAAAVAEPDENDTWVDPRTGEVFHRLSPFERKVVSLVIGEGVERLKLLQELKVDPEEQVRRRTRARTSLIRPDRPDPHPSRVLPDLADRAHPTPTVRDPRPRSSPRRHKAKRLRRQHQLPKTKNSRHCVASWNGYSNSNGRAKKLKSSFRNSWGRSRPTPKLSKS